jgi:hypothetical protein
VNNSAAGPAGLMVLHLWTETGDRMRVRITSTIDLTSDQTTTSYAASTPEVLQAVESWLDSIVTPR